MTAMNCQNPSGRMKMILIVISVALIALFLAVVGCFLFAIGVLLGRIADNLDDCLKNTKKIVGQAEVVLPGLGRINQTSGLLKKALPALIEVAEIAPKDRFPARPTLRSRMPSR
ncbi:MAG: hypothetical protein ACRDSH_10475 [Pseudonocardiaceae bacterium]